MMFIFFPSYHIIHSYIQNNNAHKKPLTHSFPCLHLHLLISLPNQQLHKLTLTNNPIPILIHRHKHFFNLFSTLYLIFQKFNNFLKSNFSTIINIKIRKCLLKMFWCYFFIKIYCCD
mgnify:CR=1 FL=1